MTLVANELFARKALVQVGRKFAAAVDAQNSFEESVVDAADAGWSLRAIADQTDVSHETIRRILNER